MGLFLDFFIVDEVQIVVEVIAEGQEIVVVLVIDAQLSELRWAVDWTRMTSRLASRL